MRLFRLSTCQRPALEWLWPYWLAQERLTILESGAGLGKSLVALDVCARVTTGRPFADGSPGAPPADVVLLTGTGLVEDTIVPRLEALGANPKRVFVIENAGVGPELESLSARRPLSLLRALVEQTAPRLVVIDPLEAVRDHSLPGKLSPNMDWALNPLFALAAQLHCAVLLTRRLDARLSLHQIYRRGTPSCLFNACSSTWLLQPDSQVPSRRILLQVKNTLGPVQPSLAYEVTAHADGVPTLSWLGTSPLTMEDLLGSSCHERANLKPRDRARELLRTFLHDGPRKGVEVWAFAKEHGLAERTVKRAKQELGIRSVRGGAAGSASSYWLLPGQELPHDEGPQSDEPAAAYRRDGSEASHET